MSKKELNILKLLSEKPWEESQKVIDDKHDGKTLTLSREMLGVRTIMVVSTVIFSLFIVSYSDRMLVHDWRSLSEPWLLWINTMILACLDLTKNIFRSMLHLAKFQQQR